LKHSIILCTYAWAFIELRLLTSTSPQEPSFIVVPNTLLFRLLSARTPPCGAWIMLLSMGLSLSGFSFLSNPRPLASICCTESRTPFRWGNLATYSFSQAATAPLFPITTLRGSRFGRRPGRLLEQDALLGQKSYAEIDLWADASYPHQRHTHT
jgi:hypothetical protein